MTQKDAARIDPAEVMHQIRSRVLEEVERGSKQPEEDRDISKQVAVLLQSMSELAIADPFEGRPITTSYPYPLTPLALRMKRAIQNEIRWRLGSFVQEQRRLNATTTAALLSILQIVENQKELTERLMNDIQNAKAVIEKLKSPAGLGVSESK